MTIDVRAAIDDPQVRATIGIEELTDAFLERIHAAQATVNAFITVADDYARGEARRVAAGRGGSLDGMVVGVKDDVDVAGLRCTVGSRLWADRVPDEDAELVTRLRSAGAVIVGKTNLHELAYGATSNNPHYGAVRNPWALERIPGGSSGGSGAALAADLCIGAIGSDAGGSVRVPAALTGVSGFRPTIGSVPSRGAYTLSPATEVIGPLARSVRDIARIFDAIEGHDPRDPLSSEHAPLQTSRTLEQGAAGLVVGVPKGFFFDDVDAEIVALVREAADVLARCGADVREVELPDATDAVATSIAIISAEALAIHRERLEREPELFGEDVRRRLELGRLQSGADIAAAMQRQREWRVTFDDALARVDVVLTPTTRIVASRIADAEMIATTLQLTRNTWPFSLAGVPGLSVPCGFTRAGLPVGMHLAAPRWRDATVLRAGAAYQDATEWHRRRAPSAAGAVALRPV